MDMKKILENMDSAAAGNRPGAGADAGSMKAILESINKVQEAPIKECGDNMMASQEMPMSAEGGHPVTVSVTASGKDNVADLISLMQQAAGIDAPQAPMAISHDHEPEMELPAKGQEMDMATMRSIMSAGDDREEAAADDDGVEEWSNSPEGSEGEEQYIDHEYMTRDLSGGLNREKPKGAERVKDPAVESIKEQLWAALIEKKTIEGRGRGKKKLKASRGNEDIKVKKGGLPRQAPHPGIQPQQQQMRPNQLPMDEPQQHKEPKSAEELCADSGGQMMQDGKCHYIFNL